jgi:hypothetical protein
MTISPSPVGGTVSPAVTTVCGPVNNGTISLTGQSGSILRWEMSTNGGGTWTTVPGNNTSATLNFSNLAQTTAFRVVIQSGVCPLAYSTNGVVSMVPPTAPTATSSPSEICIGESVNLLATSGLTTTWRDIDATFNQANPAGWLIDGKANNFPANADNASTFPWSETNGPKTPFNGGVEYNNKQTDGKFAIASGLVNTKMETPVFTTIGMSAAVLKFYQALVFTAGASGKIEISTDGGATYNKTLIQYTGPLNIGNPASSWVPLNIDLTDYIGLSNLRIRFTYSGADNSNWAIDGLNVEPPGPVLNYTWVLTNPSGVSSPYYLDSVNSPNPTATPPGPGTYTYQLVSTIGGCPGGSTTVSVTVKALPVVTPVNSCIGGGTVTFTQTGGAAGGTWSVSGGGTINSTTGVFTPATAGCFTVTYKTGGPGCTDTRSFVVFPAAPVLTATNTCNTVFVLPVVTAVNGFSVQYSINNGAWSASPALPTAPGCYSIQARYVLATACGTNTVGTVTPGCVSNTANIVIFPTVPAPVVSTGCGPIVVTAPPAVAGFAVQYSFDDGATWGPNTPPTADNCTGYKIKIRYVTAASCGTIAAGTAGAGLCGESVAVTRKVDNTKPILTCPGFVPVCEVPTKTYAIAPLTTSDNCSASSALIISYSITGATTRSGSGLDASGIFEVGTSTITWTVVDECGNSNSCTTEVKINPKPKVDFIYHN